MSSWKLHNVSGTQTTFARAIEGLDRIRAYVDYDQWEDEEVPLSYFWSVQDGSCGQILESAHVDGDKGLAAAQAAADAAVSRLFPGH
ncbi:MULTISPECIES: hypothetical protein [Mycolicibacter]|uniref:DRBM domain-containing protein n=2 Tax=Mycolicibacter TaxID=1073531 RepID=A0ABU5XM82_9MYCO|nr:MULTISPECIES: hypothetical protein [unclassified Mycolicibacter]MEB3023385.1 hypothetical protein [Mycolicibacter sp. MYC098]MEB3033727.1 hypothetical protein [Mycolicibacter sp. MYC340]